MRTLSPPYSHRRSPLSLILPALCGGHWKIDETAAVPASAMSRSPSPASSLDFFESDASSEQEYRPRRTTKRTAAAAAASKRAGPSAKVNPRVAQRAAQAMDEVLGDEYDEEDGEEGSGLVGRRGIDLSGQELVRDHEIRPLWVDEQGNMFVSFSSSPLSLSTSKTWMEADYAVFSRLLRPWRPEHRTS